MNRNRCIDVHGRDVISIRELASLIGILVSTLPVVQVGPFYYREPERQKIQTLRCNAGSFDAKTFVKNKMKSQINW